MLVTIFIILYVVVFSFVCFDGMQVYEVDLICLIIGGWYDGLLGFHSICHKIFCFRGDQIDGASLFLFSICIHY